MPGRADAIALRQCALAVAVLHDIDLTPAPDGIALPTDRPVVVTWAECRRALQGSDPTSDEARRRLAHWLVIRRSLAEALLGDLERRARPYGACVDSPLHPGLDWVRRRVLGDALDLGIGIVGLDPEQPQAVVPVPHELLRAAGVNADPWWPTAIVYLERMGAMAAERLVRESRPTLRPMGDCDVVTLLGSRTLRHALVAGISDGMRTVAVPMRTRGWTDLSRVDPAFAAAAASLTDDADRGFSRPLLLTREEVATAKPGGDVLRSAMEDELPDVIDLRDVIYHV